MLDLEKRVWKQKNFVVQYFDYFFIDMVAAPPVGFNLTFVCPDGQVIMSYVFLCSLGTRRSILGSDGMTKSDCSLPL